jgi:hypothetical protein
MRITRLRLETVSTTTPQKILALILDMTSGGKPTLKCMKVKTMGCGKFGK